MNNNSQASRIHIIITGRVQNVGFRAFVQKAATHLSITGWVRNVKYDQVEVVAEGPLSSLDDFLDMLKIGPLGSRVDDLNFSRENFNGEFSRFSIRTSH